MGFAKCDVQTLVGHTGTVNSMAVLSNGLLVSCRDDTTIRLWDISSGYIVKTLIGSILPNSHVNFLALYPNGSLAAGSSDRNIRVWDTQTGQIIPRMIIRDDIGSVLSLVVLSDGRLVNGSGEQTIRIWDINTGKPVKRLNRIQIGVRLLKN
jgi:WD40 repeat protein